jgi:putative NIF3 family GTP cyclohydrolase 1 type 2
VAERFPLNRAEPWDRIGLLAGDPERTVTGVALALDPTRSAIAAAAQAGANVLVTHHPAFLEPPAVIRPGKGSGGVVFAALDAGVALINAHTNLDRDAEAQRLLPSLLDLEPIRPLEISPMPATIVTAYVPPDHELSVAASMERAGAGRIGDYTGCSFSGQGVGRFSAAPGASPAVGSAGETTEVTEVRLEMVCDPRRANEVVAAAVAAHPYEEPLVTVAETRIARNGSAVGMICGMPRGQASLSELAELAGRTFGVTPRVWGSPKATIRQVVTATGSAGSLLEAALAAGVDALVAGEVRYHDALDAAGAGLAVVELGHDVTEWPLVGLLERTVRDIEGLGIDDVMRLPAETAWWTP